MLGGLRQLTQPGECVTQVGIGGVAQGVALQYLAVDRHRVRVELVQLQKATQIDKRCRGSCPVANQVLRGMQIGVDHGQRCDGQRAAEQIGGHPVIAPGGSQHTQLVQAQTRQLGLVHHL